jgi:hypothetical protein
LWLKGFDVWQSFGSLGVLDREGAVISLRQAQGQDDGSLWGDKKQRQTQILSPAATLSVKDGNPEQTTAK